MTLLFCRPLLFTTMRTLLSFSKMATVEAANSRMALFTMAAVLWTGVSDSNSLLLYSLLRSWNQEIEEKTAVSYQINWRNAKILRESSVKAKIL